MGDKFRSGARGKDSSYIDNLVFSPEELKAKVGDTIAWINKDIVAHTATARGGFDVIIEANKSASLILTKAGIVEYYCRSNHHEGTDHHHAGVKCGTPCRESR
jgi:plastocyanin